MSSPNAESISYLSPKEIEAYLDKLIKEKSLYGELLEKLDCGVGAVGADLSLICHNRKFKTLLGGQIDMSDTPFFARTRNEELKRFLSDSLSRRTRSKAEFRFGDGQSLVFVSISGFSVSDDGFAFVVRDITDEKRRLSELKRLESLAAVSNVSSVLAHEINNPLSAISVQADLLKRRAQKEENAFVIERMRIIKSEIDRIKDIVQSFLFSSRPLQATLLLQDPERLIDELARFVEPDLKERGIDLSLVVLRPLPYAEFDYDLLYSCLLNLVKNSVEAIGEKQGVRQIKIVAARRFNSLVISVEDTGSGIREEDAEKIFKPYFTTKANGTGLGLSNVYKIVRMHSGEMEAGKGENGEGARFSIVLPLRKEDWLALDAQGNMNGGAN